MNAKLQALSKNLEGTLHFDQLLKTLYATDASVYRILPLAVAYPKTVNDIIKLIDFAKNKCKDLDVNIHKESIILKISITFRN